MIRKQVEVLSKGSKIIFRPGNGNRYEVYIVEIDEGKVLFSWTYEGGIRGNSAILNIGHGFIGHPYFAEKMGLAFSRKEDIEQLLIVLHEETGVAVGLPGE